MMKKFSKSQKGLTFISLVLILFVLGFFALLIMKIGPIYLNHLKVKDTMASMKKEGDMSTYSKAKVRDTVEKRLYVNMVDHVEPENIIVVKTPSYVSIEIDYEVIENIVGNLDVLVTFNEKYEAGRR